MELGNYQHAVDLLKNGHPLYSTFAADLERQKKLDTLKMFDTCYHDFSFSDVANSFGVDLSDSG